MVNLMLLLIHKQSTNTYINADYFRQYLPKKFEVDLHLTKAYISHDLWNDSIFLWVKDCIILLARFQSLFSQFQQKGTLSDHFFSGIIKK